MGLQTGVVVHGGWGHRKTAELPGLQDGPSPFSLKNHRELEFLAARIWGLAGLQDLLETQLPLKFFLICFLIVVGVQYYIIQVSNIVIRHLHILQ